MLAFDRWIVIFSAARNGWDWVMDIVLHCMTSQINVKYDGQLLNMSISCFLGVDPNKIYVSIHSDTISVRASKYMKPSSSMKIDLELHLLPPTAASGHQ